MLAAFFRRHLYFLSILVIPASFVVLVYIYAPSRPPQGALFFRTLTQQNTSNLEAAALSISPSSGNYNVGDTITISLLVNTSDKSINAVAGKINFPVDKLEVTSISKSNSILTLWVEDPSYSNKDGVISFSGVSPSPGFNGPAGQVISIVFKVKAEGDAVIETKEAQVLANDGLGTDILTDVSPSKVSLVKPVLKNSDINGDNKVDLTDMSILVGNFGTGKNQKFDLNGDGKVDIRDLSILAAKWTPK